LPQHIAIIMDGNGRWAVRRGLPRTAGHRAGIEALRSVVEGCIEHGVRYLTVFAFSTENWRRPKSEVDALMGLLVEYFDREIVRLCREGVRVRIIGEREGLTEAVREAIESAEDRTRCNERLDLIVAFNYGSRAEICRAARTVAALASKGELDPETVDEANFGSYLYTAGIPDPDLLIRPSGEMRLSNFLLWQCAYSEFWFTSVYWPDFTKAHLAEAIAEYRRRARRYGGLGAAPGG
jgi:undecaprenyl diphosphate synthase